MKKNKIPSWQIVHIIEPKGAATATDLIMVGGNNIGYMYREKPINDIDTGWRFFAGFENEAYIRNNDNTDFYDINTIANYDPSIIPYLNELVGTKWERIPNTNKFNRIKE